MKGLHGISFILLVIGGLNWLIFGIWKTDLGAWIGGTMDSGIASIIYVLVGLAAIYELLTHKKNCKMCGSSASGQIGS
ncbi:MAG: DUF378 domain-containing protein [Candidatus Vogelbacteria bacterium]|nr:DUF378 domain-containing protein [Candidatus Vogelbacteria bacterium]